LVRHMREKARLRNQFVQQVRNVFLALGRKGLLIPGASAKRDDDNLPLLARCLSANERTGAHQRAAQGHARCATQEVAPAAAEAMRHLTWAQCRSDQWGIANQLNSSPLVRAYISNKQPVRVSRRPVSALNRRTAAPQPFPFPLLPGAPLGVSGTPQIPFAHCLSVPREHSPCRDDNEHPPDLDQAPALAHNAGSIPRICVDRRRDFRAERALQEGSRPRQLISQARTGPSENQDLNLRRACPYINLSRSSTGPAHCQAAIPHSGEISPQLRPPEEASCCRPSTEKDKNENRKG